MKKLGLILGTALALLLLMGASSVVFADQEVVVPLKISANILIKGQTPTDKSINLLQQMRLNSPELNVEGVNIRQVVIRAYRTKAEFIPHLVLQVNGSITDSIDVEDSAARDYTLVTYERQKLTTAVLMIENSTGLSIESIQVHVGAPDEVVIKGNYPAPTTAPATPKAPATPAPSTPAPVAPSAPVQPPPAPKAPPKAPAVTPKAPTPQPAAPKAPPKPPKPRGPQLPANTECYRVVDLNNSRGYMCVGDLVENVYGDQLRIVNFYSFNGFLRVEAFFADDDQQRLLQRYANDLVILNSNRLER